MKRLLATLAMTVFAAALSAKTATIVMKDGKVHKNVEVLNVNALGIDVAFKGKLGEIVKHVPFSDVSEKTQKEFGYSPEKAKKLREERDKMIERHRKIREEIQRRKEAGEKYYQHQHPTKRLTKNEIENSGVRVLLKVITAENGGVVAWADTPNATVTTGHLGKVFVRGLDVTNGGEWGGTIYPTGTTVGDYPCYTPYMYMAIGDNEAR